MLGKKKAVAQHVTAVLQPYVEGQMGDYFARQGISKEFVPTLPEESRLPFYLMWCGDGLTGMHSMNASYVVRAISKLMGADQEPTRLAQAGLLHDIGKGNIPRLILEDPTPRDLQGPLCAINLADPLRPVGKEVESPIALTDEERAFFGPLLSGHDKNPELVRKFGELCASKSKADYRKAIPVRTLMGLARYVSQHEALPPDLEEYVERYLDERAKKDVEHMVKIFKNHKEDLENLDMILARYGIDGWEDTLLRVLHRHESESFAYVPDYLGCVVARHHNYPLTQRTLGTTKGYVPSPDAVLYTSLTLSDIIVALAEYRPYFRNGKPKPINIIRNILIDESTMYGIPRETINLVIDKLLGGSEEERPLQVILERSSEVLQAA